MAKQMKIKLLPDGQIYMETVGIKGKKCTDCVELLKKLIDIKVTKTQITQEYYENETELEVEETSEIRWDN